MPTDTLDTVWAYRQATQECRNRERMNAYIAKRDNERRFLEWARQQAQAQHRIGYWRLLQAVVAERDVTRMVAEDERALRGTDE